MENRGVPSSCVWPNVSSRWMKTERKKAGRSVCATLRPAPFGSRSWSRLRGREGEGYEKKSRGPRARAAQGRSPSSERAERKGWQSPGYRRKDLTGEVCSSKRDAITIPLSSLFLRLLGARSPSVLKTGCNNWHSTVSPLAPPGRRTTLRSCVVPRNRKRHRQAYCWVLRRAGKVAGTP